MNIICQVGEKKEVTALGDVTDLILEGFLCEACGDMIDGVDVGFPRECESCRCDDGSMGQAN